MFAFLNITIAYYISYAGDTEGLCLVKQMFWSALWHSNKCVSGYVVMYENRVPRQ